jgi:hypothetical protein
MASLCATIRAIVPAPRLGFSSAAHIQCPACITAGEALRLAEDLGDLQPHGPDAPQPGHELEVRPLVKIPEEEQVTDFRERSLLPEHSGILVWVVRGCLDWQQQGLRPPLEVIEARNTYRREMDVILEFLTECCERREGVSTASLTLYTVYGDWCQAMGIEPLSQRAFNTALEACRFTKSKRGSMVWHGLKLRGAAASPARPRSIGNTGSVTPMTTSGVTCRDTRTSTAAAVSANDGVLYPDGPPQGGEGGSFIPLPPQSICVNIGPTLPSLPPGMSRGRPALVPGSWRAADRPGSVPHLRPCDGSAASRRRGRPCGPPPHHKKGRSWSPCR